jgi:hypothetical protein
MPRHSLTPEVRTLSHFYMYRTVPYSGIAESITITSRFEVPLPAVLAACLQAILLEIAGFPPIPLPFSSSSES